MRIEMPVNRSNTNEQTDKTAESARNTAAEATRKARAIAEEAAKASEQAARAGVDIAREGASTMRDNVLSSLETAVHGFQRMTDQFTQVLGGPEGEELARRSSQNIEAVSQASTMLARGFHEASQVWFGLARDQMAKNMDALNRLVQCRSIQDAMAIQSELVRDNLQQTIDTSRRIAELSTRLANEAARTIQAPASSSADRVRRIA
jgi:phasin family protein